MSNIEHVLHNRTTTSQPPQATKRRPGRPPASRVVPVAASDEPIAESSCGPARRAATAGDPEVDLTDEAPSRAADYSAGPPVTQRSATLGHPTPKEGEAPPLFENSDEELEYLRREDARLEKQREIERLRT
jgi:hypothetical protein